MNVVEMHREIANHASKIRHLFKPGAKVSIVVRNPSLPDGDVLVSDDQIDDVKRALDRLATKEVQHLKAFEG